MCGCVDDQNNCTIGETRVVYEYSFSTFYYDQSQSIKESIRNNIDRVYPGDFYTYYYTPLLYNYTNDYF